MRDASTGFGQYALQTNKHSVVFQYILSSVAKALDVTHPTPPVKFVINIDCLLPMIHYTNEKAAYEIILFRCAPNMNIAVPLCNLGLSCTIARSQKNRRMDISTKAGTAVV